MINFHVGQKVVCVDAVPSGNGDGELDGLTEGSVYTIRKIGPTLREWCEAGEWIDPTLDIWLEEIRRPGSLCDQPGSPELGYLATRFRPVVEPDISVFTAMLAPSPKVRARETEHALEDAR